MSRRFFVDTPIQGDHATLTGHEVRHLSNVMRGKVGDEVVLFDGSGVEFAAQITSVERSQVELKVIGRSEVDRELPFELTVGVALPKGDRQRGLVEKLVELGATRLVPLITNRSVAQPLGKAIGRLRRGVIEASKQCGRNRLMEVTEARRIDDYLDSFPDNELALFAHPGGVASTDLAFDQPSGRDVRIAIGPEGGFTDEEQLLADRSHWQRLSLGPRVLRTETAAVVLAAYVVLHQE